MKFVAMELSDLGRAGWPMTLEKRDATKDAPPDWPLGLFEEIVDIPANILVADIRKHPELYPDLYEPSERSGHMAKFETIPITELKTRLPAKLMPLVEEFREKLEKLRPDQGGRLTLEKGDDPKDLRRALKAAAASLNRRIRFPFRGEEGAVSFYLEGRRGRRGGRGRAEAETGRAEAPRRRRGRPRKAGG